MNRKSFLSAILIAVAAMFLPSPSPAKKFEWQNRLRGLTPPKVFGPLIGEGTGTTHSNPEVVAPLDQLKKMLSESDELNVKVSGRLRGKDQITKRIEIKEGMPLDYFKKHPANKLRYIDYRINANRKN